MKEMSYGFCENKLLDFRNGLKVDLPKWVEDGYSEKG
jgi:hypothetical protein